MLFRSGDVEVQDLASSVFDDEKAVAQLKSHGRHGEEVESGDHLAVILEEGQPALAGVAPAVDTPEMPRHGPFRDDDAEFPKFSVDLGCAPACIRFRQPVDERRISAVIFGRPPRGRERQRQ